MEGVQYGAKGEGVPGRALRVASASCGSAFDGEHTDRWGSTDYIQGEGTQHRLTSRPPWILWQVHH